MAGVRGNGARFAPRKLPAEDAAAFVRAGIDRLRTGYAVEALVAAPAPVVRQRVGQWCRVHEAGPGRCRVRMETDVLDWPALVLGAVRAEFTVVAPDELRERLGEWSSGPPGPASIAVSRRREEPGMSTVPTVAPVVTMTARSETPAERRPVAATAPEILPADVLTAEVP